ncbi:MAG: Zn-dependent hydrolase [Rhodospirillales bacterium]|nr:Zn-dependent hydrolase [Rhodospirillales bacterium]
MTNIETNQDRLWSTLMDLGQLGETEIGGCNRVEFTALNKQARDLFCSWAKDAGCEIFVDGFGNIRIRRQGKNPDAPVVMCGSHLDTQPTGGKFDGIYGVLGGLEAIRSLNDAGVETDAPIEVVVWTNEEGYMFQPMMGSAVWTGMLPLEDAFAMRDEKIDFGICEGLDRMGYLGDAPFMDRAKVACYIELHIEQGPVLGNAGEIIGVVDATQGQHWYDLELTGVEAHAGPTPMPVRKDAMMGMSRIALEVKRIAEDNMPACGTCGFAEVFPNSRNTIPGRVKFSADLRHPNPKKLAAMDMEFREVAKSITDEMGLKLSLSEFTFIKPLPFNQPLADGIEKAALATQKPYRRMFTGAGHDACNIARFLPTAMIFIPCRDGISHNELEWAEADHCKIGADVLVNTLMAAANGQITYE